MLPLFHTRCYPEKSFDFSKVKIYNHAFTIVKLLLDSILKLVGIRLVQTIVLSSNHLLNMQVLIPDELVTYTQKQKTNI